MLFVAYLVLNSESARFYGSDVLLWPWWDILESSIFYVSMFTVWVCVCVCVFIESYEELIVMWWWSSVTSYTLSTSLWTGCSLSALSHTNTHRDTQTVTKSACWHQRLQPPHLNDMFISRYYPTVYPFSTLLLQAVIIDVFSRLGAVEEAAT